jgi:hypothetical protein
METPFGGPLMVSLGFHQFRHSPFGTYTVRLRSPMRHTGATRRSGPKKYWSHRPRSFRWRGSSNGIGRMIGAIAPALRRR